MKDFIVTMIILLMIFMPIIDEYITYLSEETQLNPYDYARITDVEYQAKLVDEPGGQAKIIVKERLTFDIHAASRDNTFWELWKDLPEDYVDGLKVSYKVNSVKQILDNGTELVYEESPRLYWEDYDYVETNTHLGPYKWYHSEGPYSEYNRNYECVFFYINDVYRDQMTFEIEYEMYNAAMRYKDCSELYLSMYSEDTVNHLKSFKGEILIPKKDMPSSGNYDAHTYGTNSNSFKFTESSTLHPGFYTFSFDLDESDLKFKPYNEYIEFSLVAHGNDKHIFTEYAPNNYYSSDNVLEEIREEQKIYDHTPKEYIGPKFLVFIICCGGAYLVIKYSFNIREKMKKKYNLCEPTIDFNYFRDIPSNLDPTFAADLVFCKDKTPKDAEGYSAIILSLVRKGYIELDRISDKLDWTFENVKIIITHQSENIAAIEDLLSSDDLNPSTIAIENSTNEPLTLTEKYYFNLINRHAVGSEISMRRLQDKVSLDYVYTDTFVTNIESSTVNIGVSQGYFQKANYLQPKNEVKSKSTKFIVLGIILLTLVNIISYNTRMDLAFGGYTILGIALIIGAIKLRQNARHLVLLTQFGEDEYIKWRSLYNYLNSETLMDERTVVELPIWEQYLIYATAFGISDKVINALNIRCPEADMSPVLRNPYYRTRSFHHSSRSFRSATRSASHHYRSSSYGGYGGSHGGFGGYGGGGRGGGGGGGGH